MKNQCWIILPVIIELFSLAGIANSITETQYTFGNSIDTRLEVNASNFGDITAADMELLRNFTDSSISNQVGVIACSKENLDLVLHKLKNIDPTYPFEVRYYQDNPWILNKKAAENLPKLTGDTRFGVQTVFTIEIAPGDVRVVFIKDNKNYAMNVGGIVEDDDVGLSNEDTNLNAAKRELNEEVKLANVSKDNFTPIGQTNFTVKKALLKDLEWREEVNLYTYGLDVIDTASWLQSNSFEIKDELINSFSVLNNEVEWVFIVKPDAFKSSDIILPINEGKTVKVGANHADAAAVVLKGKFDKEVLIGRDVNYINGNIKFGNAEVEFIKTRR